MLHPALRAGCLILAAALACAPCAAFELQMVTRAQAKDLRTRLDQLGVRGVSLQMILDSGYEPVHERIMLMSYGCPGQPSCAAHSERGHVSMGLQWNDNPPDVPSLGACQGKVVMLPHRSGNCWLAHMLEAKRNPDAGYGEASLMAQRSHYGDMQFLHAMASAPGEAASTTLEHMMAWAEYSYRLSLRGGLEQLDVEAPVRQFAGLAPWFQAEKRHWTGADLFMFGHEYDEPLIRDMAFGSLLHLLQDSYSQSHVQRDYTADGLPIERLLTYRGQSSHCHAKADRKGPEGKKPLATNLRAAIEMGRELIALRERTAPWTEAEGLLRGSAFRLAADVQPAGTGAFTSKNCK
ncbi:hypothetical protein [Stenotrophomonas maltophilia]|uniref:hypothetical protein n=2 Tax=Stenotrophomonas TaxID=40323 RepID=UPI0006AC1DCD|nr:hypothetical protein [Stenotrophomonas maltophilia]KOQ69809.1 hypothetical protein ABW44_18400 [Stenotrophomonas maltophilia]